jgi:hypothetical protein
MGHLLTSSIDDEVEWNRETSRMGVIYRNAVLTISASNASHVGFGFLHKRPETRYFTNRLRSKGSPGQVMVREPCCHTNLHNSTPTEETWPLFRRAWCLQERLMSTRIIHFAAGELLWECSSSAACECGHMDVETTSRLRYDRASLDQLTATERAQAWDDLTLGSYQTRFLTKEADRFPALSSLAQQFQTEDLGRYVAGLWFNFALSMMLWEVGSGHQAVDYVAPSWSWAKIQGQMRRDGVVAHNSDLTASLETMEGSLASDDPYGAITSAKATILTPICEGQLRIQGHHSKPLIHINQHVRAFFRGDTALDRKLLGSQVRCAFFRGMTTAPDGRYIEALVLKASKFMDSFERIGIAHLTEVSLPWIGTVDLRQERVTLI